MSAIEREIICIVCAKGCRAEVWENEKGGIQWRGTLCRNGQEYVRLEFRDPRRILATTVKVEGSSLRFPVRSRGPVPKAKLMECMKEIRALRVKPPVHIGDVLIADLLGTGQDLIASADLPGVPVPTAPATSGAAWHERP